MTRTGCRSCGASALEHVLDLGEQAPSNALLKSFDQPEKRYPLRLAVCTSCWLMQTEVDVPHAELFPSDYPYYSGGSAHWREHCKAYAANATKRFGLARGSYVVEVGGNDGTMLSNFTQCDVLNVEPSVNVARAAMSKNIPTLVGRFQDVQLNAHGADLIIANNVLAHDPDLNGFAAAIARGLAPQGTATIEFPWAVRLLADGLFDTVYHEHYSYLSIASLAPLLARHGLYIYDAEVLEVHGGSLRVYVTSNHFKPQTPAVDWLLEDEGCLRDPRSYAIFRERAFNCAGAFVKFLQERPRQVCGMGAAAKATVFANFCQIDLRDILMIGDVTPAKWGKFLPGSRIPIVTEADVLAAAPDYIWIAAWNWRAEIAASLRAQGYKGNFVVALPELEVFE